MWRIWAEDVNEAWEVLIQKPRQHIRTKWKSDLIRGFPIDVLIILSPTQCWYVPLTKTAREIVDSYWLLTAINIDTFILFYMIWNYTQSGIISYKYGVLCMHFQPHFATETKRCIVTKQSNKQMYYNWKTLCAFQLVSILIAIKYVICKKTIGKIVIDKNVIR